MTRTIPWPHRRLLSGALGAAGKRLRGWGALAALIVAPSACREDEPRHVDPPAAPPPVESPAQAPSVDIPVTGLTAPVTMPPAQVLVTRTDVMFGGESIVHFEDPASRVAGAPAALKRNGEKDMYITPLHTALARHRERESPRPSTSELALLADGTTPYRLLFEILFTAGQSEYGKYHLVVRGKHGLSALSFTPPSTGKLRTHPVDALNLAVVIEDGGVKFKTSFGAIATGCAETDGALAIRNEVTVPRASGSLEPDLAAIRACARTVKATRGGKYAGEREVTVTATSASEYRHVIAVIETLRGDREELFPDFTLGVTK